MARGNDERHNPNRKVGRVYTTQDEKINAFLEAFPGSTVINTPFEKWHVMHNGETIDIHETEQDAKDAINNLVETGFDDVSGLYVERRTED